MKTLRIVIASPSDVNRERNVLKRIIGELDAKIGRPHGLRIVPYTWETDSAPGFHALGPQGLIDEALKIDSCDLLVGIFWSRFGTPVADAQSGTEHEINLAYSAWKRMQIPQIMIYFSKAPRTPQNEAEIEQLRRLQEFRSRLPKEGFAWPYKDHKDFAESARRHLRQFIGYHIDRTSDEALRHAAPNNLPLPPDISPDRTLLGQQLLLAIKQGGVVVVNGMGGAGKNALAVSSAHLATKKGLLPGGIAYIDCEHYHRLEECLHTAAFIFSGDRMDNQSFESCATQVLHYLTSQKAMLFLRSAEIIITHPEFLNWVAQVRPPARLLVTTRVTPPGMPGHARVIPVRELEPKVAIDYFIKLSKQRGAQDLDTKLVKQLCSAVGNLPLAIELLSAHSQRIPLSALLDRVHSGLQILEDKSPTISERHRSIKACFAVSVNRLSQTARDLFYRFSRLPYGANSDLVNEFGVPFVVHDAAEELVGASVWSLAGTRYVVHPLLMKFAAEEMGADVAASAWQKVSLDLVNLATRKGLSTTPGEKPIEELVHALDWLENEWRNISACIEALWSNQQRECPAKLSDALRDFFFLRGHWPEAERLYRRVLDERRRSGDRAGEARTLTNLALIYGCMGGLRLEEAVPAYSASYDIYAELNDAIGMGRSRSNQAHILNGLGRHEEAEKLCLDGCGKLKLTPDVLGFGIARAILANIYMEQQKWQKASSCYEESLAILKDHGDFAGEAIALANLGIVYGHLGKWKEAEARLRESLPLRRRLRARIGEGDTLIRLAELSAQQNDLEHAIKFGRHAISTLKKAWHDDLLKQVEVKVNNWEQRYKEATI